MRSAIIKLGAPEQRESPMRPRWKLARLFAVLVLVLAVHSVPALGVQDPPSRRLPDPTFVGSVTAKNPLFWNGELFVETATGPAALIFIQTPQADRTCNPDPDSVTPYPDSVTPCWAYRFEVTEPADTLRIAMDLNTREDCFLVEVFGPGAYEDPTKTQATHDPNAGDHLLHCPEFEIAQRWNKEAFYQKPEVGMWTIRIVPHRVQNLGFRFRVALENDVQPEADKEGVLPNLVPYPPYEFGFVAPANPLAGVAFDHLNPPGPPGISCTADELAEAAEDGRNPLRCLRFSFGLYNAGPGLFDVQLNGAPLALEGTATQRIRDADGNVVEEVEPDAGVWKFHATHGHPHYLGDPDDAGFVAFELYRVNASTKTLTFVPSSKPGASTSGAKTGMHPIDLRFLHWHKVKQGGDKSWRCGENCFGLTNGWGDNYRWQRPGNYVEFPLTDADGDYVLRVIVDRDDFLVETKETDNVAYAWIRVTGDQVTICERGLGLSPWDRPKVIHRPSFWLDTPGGTTADSATEACSR